MTESQNAPIAISIDQRKNRIRIYKSLLQHLGFPKYIQLLVNPSNKCVAIKVVEKRSPGDQSERIKPIELMVNDCCELYSKSFIKKLCEVYGALDPHYTYRLTGKIVHTHNMAVFSLESLTPVEM